ncbi:hypothetical protein M885DRAFT_517344 [Pelagophyceae sp. CCMP2097]|nr:hypothetical protein M885DRAFT_517344 [Pelagophyceae sp. CCMP2097]
MGCPLRRGRPSALWAAVLGIAASWAGSAAGDDAGRRPLCAEENMLFAGTWRLVADAEAALPCCGWDDEPESMQYDAACGPRTFRMAKDGSYRGPSVGFAEVGGKACHCAPPEHKYAWDAPSACSIAPWNAKAFCKLIGNGTLALIGDSTMAQAASTLMNMISVGKGGCQEQVVSAAGDTLLGRNLGLLNRGKHWLDAVRSHDPDWVVVSAGAHVYGEEKYDAVVDAVLEALRPGGLPLDIAKRYAPHVPGRPLRVSWKTQQPGGCAKSIVPRDGETDCFDGVETHYNYGTFLARDARTLAKIRAAAINAPHALSAIDMRMLYWRKDAHVSSMLDEPVAAVDARVLYRHKDSTQFPPKPDKYDCLHYCLRTDVLSSTFPRMLQHDLETRIRQELAHTARRRRKPNA